MTDTFLAPDDFNEAFPDVDLTVNKPLWLIGINFAPRKLVVMAEWLSPEMTSEFGHWVRAYGSIAYLAKQCFNFGPKRGFYIAEMASQDLVNQHTRKLEVSAVNSDRLLIPGAKSSLMMGVFLGPTGTPFVQSPIHGGRRAKWGGGAAASAGLVLQHAAAEPDFGDGVIYRLANDFMEFCATDRSPLTNLDAAYVVPFVITEDVTGTSWEEIATTSGVVPASMFDEEPKGQNYSVPEHDDLVERVEDVSGEIQSAADRALAIADTLPVFGKERAAEIHQVPGPDDYTASIYAYSFEIASLYMQELAYGAPRDENPAIGEALTPLLFAEDFDYPAWNSAIGTIAARLTVRIAAELPKHEQEYVLSFAPQMALVPGFEDNIASMYAEFLQAYQDEPEGAARHAAASAIQSASDGSVSLYFFTETQSWELIDEAWASAVRLFLDALSNNDPDGSKAASMRVAANEWKESQP